MSDAIVPEKKSWVQRFVERAHGAIEQAPAGSPIGYARATGSTAKDFGVAGLLGGALGVSHAKFGNDTKFGAVEGWIAAAGALGAIGLSGTNPTAAALANRIGSEAFTVWSFRKAYELAAGRAFSASPAPLPTPRVQSIPAKPGTGPGIAGEDPIERVARSLG